MKILTCIPNYFIYTKCVSFTCSFPQEHLQDCENLPILCEAGCGEKVPHSSVSWSHLSLKIFFLLDEGKVFRLASKKILARQ